jgi:hypothetical protein
MTDEYKLFCQHCDHDFYVRFDLERDNAFRCQICCRLNKVHIEAIKRRIKGLPTRKLFEPRVNDPVDDTAIYCYWDD